MFSTWLIFGGCLAILQYIGLSLSTAHEDKKRSSSDVTHLKGVWITSKVTDFSLTFIFFLFVSWAFAFGKDDGNFFAGSSQFFVQGIRIDNNSGSEMSTVFFTFTITALSTLVVAEKVRNQFTNAALPCVLPISQQN